jgi:hypothetical protein
MNAKKLGIAGASVAAIVTLAGGIKAMDELDGRWDQRIEVAELSGYQMNQRHLKLIDKKYFYQDQITKNPNNTDARKQLDEVLKDIRILEAQMAKKS